MPESIQFGPLQLQPEGSCSTLVTRGLDILPVLGRCLPVQSNRNRVPGCRSSANGRPAGFNGLRHKPGWHAGFLRPPSEVAKTATTAHQSKAQCTPAARGCVAVSIAANRYHRRRAPTRPMPTTPREHLRNGTGSEEYKGRREGGDEFFLGASARECRLCGQRRRSLNGVERQTGEIIMLRL